MDHTTPDAEALEHAPSANGRSTDDAGDAPLDAGADGVTATLPPDAGTPIGPPPVERSSVFRDPAQPPARPVMALSTPMPAVLDRPADRIGAGSNGVHPVETHSRRDGGRSALIGIVSGVLGAALTVGALALAGVFDRPETVVQEITAPTPAPTRIVIDGDASSSASAVAQKVVPSIVAVEVATDNGNNSFSAFASGSGVILSADGLIVTNHHVIADADLAQVVLQGGEIYPATIIGSDRLTDLAVLQIDAEGLVPIELGGTADLSIGDQAVAVGNPLGLPGGASVTVGVLSAFDREVTVGSQVEDRLFGMLQTDAPITRGSSGGALVDGRGRLIGITTAIGVTDVGPEGVGFAIPVELMTRITDEIIQSGSVRHTFLGVELRDHLEQRNGAQVPEGAVITNLVDPSGARDAGLEIGDRVTVINGRTVHTKEDIINELRTFRVGDTVTLEGIRGDGTFSLGVILGERPTNP
jgi:S1-C subfamily serine protease